MKSKLPLIVCLTAATVFSGCATNGQQGMSNTQKGALIGVAGGALVGLLAKDKKKGALIGAVGGGIAGAAVGNYMDKQKQDFEKILKDERDAGAISIDKKADDVLLVRMTSQTAFAVGSSDIQSGFQSTMDKIINVVTQYQKTELQVVGHTDNVGSAESNQALSEKRAKAVYDYMSARGVISDRLVHIGQGETMPIASNDDDAGRTANRRVEIFIVPIVDENATETAELS